MYIKEEMASAAHEHRRVLEILQCSICLETFQKPKVLPCGHTYCASCLQSHINSKVWIKGIPQENFPCPTCRADTVPMKPQIAVEQWADSFPVNSMVASLLDVGAERNGKKSCELCLKRNRQSLATSYCYQCDKAICETCREFHDDILSSKHRYVVKFSDEGELSFVKPDLALIEMCPQHPDKHTEFICIDHNELCCSTCGFREHRKCQNITALEDYLNTFDMEGKSKDVEININSHNKQLKGIIGMVKENVQTMEKDKIAILNEIQRIRAPLETMFQNLINSVERKQTSETSVLESQQSRGERLMTAIDNDREQLDFVMNNGSEVQKLIMLHNMNQSQHRYTEAISVYQESITEVRISLDVHKNFLDLVSTLKGIGRINVLHGKYDVPPFHRDAKEQLRLESKTRLAGTPTKTRNAVKREEFSVKVSEDKEKCNISDVLELQDARLLMVDYSNCKIKIFDEDRKCTDCLVCPDKPWNACALPDGKIAVTIPHLRNIQIIGINEKMHVSRNLKTRLQCWGIAALRNLLVITTGKFENSILILEMNGVEIRTIQTQNYESEQLLGPMRIAKDPTESIVYVSYHHGNRLVAYTSNWDVHFTYTDPGIDRPAGVDTDREGNIFLCGYFSDCIQQISTEGKFVKTVKKRNKPLSIRFLREMDRFILTSGKNNAVEVYDLRA